MTTNDHQDVSRGPEPQRGSFAAFTRLLHVAGGPAEDRVPPSLTHLAKLLGVALAATVAYGAAAGFFQGHGQILVAALKAPLIFFGSVILCVPSLYVLTSLGGSLYRRFEFLQAVVGFCGVVSWVFLALLPVVWLFSVSSRSLFFMVTLHFLAWTGAALAGRRYLLRVIPGARSGALSLWIFLLVLVSLQMTTQLRPVLWRQPDEPLFTWEKRSFGEQLGIVLDFDTQAPADDAGKGDAVSGNVPGDTAPGRVDG